MYKKMTIKVLLLSASLVFVSCGGDGSSSSNPFDVPTVKPVKHG